jgi:hypothetical protein
MAIRGGERGGQADGANDDEDDRIRVAEIEVTAAHFMKKKEQADGDDNGRAHQAANGAAAARTTHAITHRISSPAESSNKWARTNCLLRTAAEAVPKHEAANDDQN